MSSVAEEVIPAAHLPLDAIADGAVVYADAFFAGLRPDQVLDVSAWAERHRILTSKEASESGPWRTARTPYLREIMDCLSSHHSCKDVVFRKASQIGGTECGNNWVGYVIDQCPAPMMYVMPTSDTAKRASKQRIAPMIEAAPTLRAKVKEARSRDSGNTTRMKDFDGGVLVMAGANSAVELRSIPIRFLYCDEVDGWPDDLDGEGDPLDLAFRRTATFARAKRFVTSTPTEKGSSRIDRVWVQSDQRYYFVPCPHCTHEQRLVWEQVRYETERQQEYACTSCGVVSDAAGVSHGPHTCPDCGEVGEATEQTLAVKPTDDVLDVWYECESCAERIDEYHKTAMLEAGRWIATNAGVGRTVGFHLNALYSPLGWYSWKEAVVGFLQSEGKPSKRKVWTNTVLGESYEDESDQVSGDELKMRAAPHLLLRQVPGPALMLTAGVDVQHDRLEVKVKGWGRGEESWLVDWQRLYGDPVQYGREGSVWTQLDELLNTRYRHASGADLRIAATAVDSGYCTHEVYMFCRERAGRHVFAVKGQSRPGKAILGKPTKQDIDWHGQTIEEGAKLWPIGVDTAKALIYGRLALLEGPGTMHFPIGLPDEYYTQLTAERWAKVVDRRTGFTRRMWVKDPGQANEALDLEVYAYAAALYAGVTRVNWERLEAIVTHGQMGLFAAPVKPPGGDMQGPDDTNDDPDGSPPPVPRGAPARRARVLHGGIRRGA